MIENEAIRVVSPGQFDLGTVQTPGSERRAAIAPKPFVNSALWGGIFVIEPGARTGIHHHGSQETVAFVLDGVCEIRWGERGEFHAQARPGDFVQVPAFLLHIEINSSKVEAFRWVVVRNTPAPIVVNLPDTFWQ